MIQKIKKLIVGLSMLLFVFPLMAGAQVSPSVQAQINDLQNRILELQIQLAQMQNVGGTSCYTFNSNIGIGYSGSDVSALSTALNRDGVSFFQNTSLIFDENLASAVSSFQEKYRSEILTPLGLSAGTGYLGTKTRAKLNSLYGCSGYSNPGTYPYYQPAYPTNPVTGTVRIGSLSQASGPAGTQVTIRGTGFTLTGNKIKVGNIGTQNNPNFSLSSYDGQTLLFQIPNNAFTCTSGGSSCGPTASPLPTGMYGISVINQNGSSNEITFTVTNSGVVQPSSPLNNLAPMISSLSPSSGNRGSEVTIIGSNFTPDSAVQFSDYGTYMSHNFVSSTALTFTVPSSLTNCNITGTSCTNTVYPPVSNGSYNIRVINGNGTSNAVTYTVTGANY